MVTIQDVSVNWKPGKWLKSGVVLEVLLHEAYLVKVHGSRALTTRNRRFLRKVVPFKPALPVSTMETQVVVPPPTGSVSKDSQDQPAQDVPAQDVPAQDVPAQDVPALPQVR